MSHSGGVPFLLNLSVFFSGAFANVNNLVSAVTGRCDAGKTSDPDMAPLLGDHKVQVQHN